MTKTKTKTKAATAPGPGLLAQLEAGEQEATAKAQERYVALVRALAAGDESGTPAQVRKILAAAGRSLTQLQQHVTAAERVTQLRQAAANFGPAEQERLKAVHTMREVERQARAARESWEKKVSEARADFQRASSPVGEASRAKAELETLLPREMRRAQSRARTAVNRLRRSLAEHEAQQREAERVVVAEFGNVILDLKRPIENPSASQIAGVMGKVRAAVAQALKFVGLELPEEQLPRWARGERGQEVFRMLVKAHDQHAAMQVELEVEERKLAEAEAELEAARADPIASLIAQADAAAAEEAEAEAQ